MAEGRDVKDLFEAWVNTDLKAQIIVFFHQNPGVIETWEGLARRLGTDVSALKKQLADHLKLGIFEVRDLGDKTVIVYDAGRRKAVQEEMVSSVERRLREEEAR